MKGNEYKIPENYPAISGILANISKGKRWDEETHVPGIHVTYSYCVGGYGVTGILDPYSDEDIRKFFEMIIKEAVAEGETGFEFSTENDCMRERLLNVFSDKSISSEIEYSLRGTQKCSELSCIPEDVTIYQVDENMINLMENGAMQNADMFLERYYNSWEDKESFLNNSAAFIAVHEGSIVGIIFGSSSYQKVVAIDIEVDEQYRRKKIAKRLAEEMLNNLIDRGFVLQWDCVESNMISYNMARSMGFEQIRERLYDWFEI